MNKALVLFSGGQDSATCLAWAIKHFECVETIGFDYGQRHSIELTIRLEFIEKLKSIKKLSFNKLGEDHLIDAKNLGSIGETAMTEDIKILYDDNGLPNTFVPARNLYFFTLAAAIAYRRGISTLVGGMCETDYSGYPDCRRDTMDALQNALSLGTGMVFKISTPLMSINKASTWALAHELGGKQLVNLIINDTHTCYKGIRDKLYDWGYGCGECPSCNLRINGFLKWKMERNYV